MDLFDRVETLPQEVQDVLMKFSEHEQTYETCANLVSELELVGYTCDYGLDASPYELEKIVKS